MLPFSIDLKAGLPVAEQILFAVKKAVVGGQLVAGDKFPSVRVLSQELKINPNTAVRADGSGPRPHPRRARGLRVRAARRQRRWEIHDDQAADEPADADRWYGASVGCRHAQAGREGACADRLRFRKSADAALD